MNRFITKKVKVWKVDMHSQYYNVNAEAKINEKKETDMNTSEKIALANDILNMESENKVKKIRKDRGLIERTESSKIILTEDNRELLKD